MSSDPAALFPGQEFPRWMYHAGQAPVLVNSAQEERDLGPEWSRVYIPREYPKAKYHWNGKTLTVNSCEEEAALGDGWANTPAAFDPYKGPLRARSKDRDLSKWLNEWWVSGLSSQHRRQIKAQLLRADGAFERSVDADPESAAVACMRQAFDGIARVLFEAGILSEDVLRKDLPQLVWDSAIAGAWWRRASATRQDIFPEKVGHYWVWRDDGEDWKGVFGAEAREWEARLLEAPEVPSREMPIDRGSVPTGQPEPPAFSSLPESPPDEEHLPSTETRVSADTASSTPLNEGRDFPSEANSIAAIAAYTALWKCSEAALARTARVDPADLSKWKKGLLPAGSDKKARIEKALKNNEGPTISTKGGRKSKYPG